MRSASAIAMSATAVLILAAPLWVAGWQQKRKANNMTNVVVATFPSEPAVLSGQSLVVRTVVDNRGADAADVPSREVPSHFAYMLRSQKDGGPVYGLSQTITDRRRSPDRIGMPPFETESLPGGEKIEWQEDIADFWNEGFEPGKYSLTVRYDRAGLESPRSLLTVLPLVVESLSSAVSEDHLSSVVAHRRQDGQVTILHRESEVRDPREGVFVVRQQLPKGGPVRVATAIDVVPAGNGRWFAWARDGQLTASVGLGNRVLLTAPAVPADGALLSPGFQVAVGTAVFGVVSPKGHLETYLATSAGLKKHWGVDLPGATGKVLWNGQADGSITVAWEEAGAGRILRQSFSAEGRAKDASPQPVTPARPAAWGMPAYGSPVVWVVVADGAAFVLGRAPVEGARTTARLPELSGAREWDFYETASGAAAVLAVSGDALHSTSLQGAEWHAVGGGRGVQSAHVVSLDGRGLWAEWVEPGFGMRRAKLR